ncbi:MAG: hypothetical protein R2939_21805 [Kofleriaceae bacterium]
MRALDHAESRDDVVGAMTRSLIETHARAGFLVVRGAELAVFSVIVAGGGEDPSWQRGATLGLDAPSMFHDVVGTQLPYRGPVLDDASRGFLTASFGAPPAELLLIPMMIRDRVVGLIYADGRNRHTFDDHYAIAARAAGLALERIVKARKS